MKIFLKPSPLKIILTFSLFVAASYLWRLFVTSRMTDIFPLGFPLPFFLAWGPCPPGEICSDFNGLWLVVDIIVWYVISAFIVDLFSERNTTA